MQHFVDRFLEGYGWQGGWHRPPFQLAALYVDQFPGDDLARERSQRFGVPLMPSIEEALTLGGSKLAVDGVLIIGEHGNYPKNEKGQTLYPRHKFFKQVTKVFEASGRSVPVFQDKHLSTNWSECVEQVAESKRLGFTYMAGSSLPVTWRIPSVDIPFGTELRESVCVSYGGVDSYDIHGLETAQCMSERRSGGEVGVKSIHAVRGARIFDLLEGREATQRLLIAALARSFSIKPPNGLTHWTPSIPWLRKNSDGAFAYFVEHRDGFRTTLFVLNGVVQDFNYAGLAKDGRVFSCQMHLPMPTHLSTIASFFSPLVHHVEEMILTGKAAYPVERTQLTSGMTLWAVESLHRGGVALETPGLEVTYQARPDSTYWRA
jgi:hypothetical protein